MALKNNNHISMSVGICSVLMVFVVLCFTTFGVLSLLSANADYKLSQKAADNTVNYYEADSLAEEMLAQIDATLYLLQGKETSEITEGLTQIEGLTLVQDEEENYKAAFAIAVSDTQQLEVVISLDFEDSRYSIEQKKLVTTVTWDEDEVTVWPGF